MKNTCWEKNSGMEEERNETGKKDRKRELDKKKRTGGAKRNED
jgi:hypothetical protein